MRDARRESEPRAARAEHASFGRRDLVVLSAVTVIAASLRLFRLGEWSLWIDEAHTFRDITSDPEVFWASGTGHYPLAFILLRGLLAIGLLPTTGEGWLRLPFAFFGILSVPVIAVFGRSVVGRRAAMLAALLLAVFPWHLYWSQNARGYSMVMLLGMLGMFAFHGGVVNRSVVWSVIGVATVAVAGLAHPSGFALMAALLGYLGYELWHDPELRERVMRPGVLVVLALVVVLAAGQAAPALVGAMEEKPDSSILHLAKTFTWYVRPEIAVATFAAWLWMLRSDASRAASLFACWIGLPLLGLGVLGSTVMKVTAQYGLVLLPAFCLATAWLLVAFHDSVRGRSSAVVRWAPALILFAPLIASDGLYFTSRHGERPRWREAADQISLESERPILVLTSAAPSVEYYLDRSRFWGQSRPEVEIVGIVPWDLERAGGGEAYFGQMRDRASAEGRDLWVLVTEPELAELDPSGGFDSAVRRAAHQLGRFPAWTGPKDMTVFVYRAHAAPR